MTAQQVVAKVKSLNLPNGQYIVFGGAPLAALNIREAKDIDLFVTDKLLSILKSQGWRQVIKAPDDKPYTFDNFEAHSSWSFSPYKPSLKHLLKTKIVLDGVAFASINEVRKWKAASGRPKDLKDIKLIDEYLSKKPS